MSLDLDHPGLASVLPRLAPHLHKLLEAGGERALFLHADEVTVEHVLLACMRDTECAAYEVVAHAFADPETVELELTALSPGIMVVGSSAALPFSPAAVDALRAARGRGERVGVGEVLDEAVAALPAEVRGELEGAGLSAVGSGSGAREETGAHLFQGFDDPARRALSLANKAASADREASIGPARLVVGCLQAEPGLEESAGLSAARARTLLRGRTVDERAPEPRRLPPDERLVAFLGAVGEPGDSLALLRAAHTAGSEELGALLRRHKVTLTLLDRARGAFQDPAPEGFS